MDLEEKLYREELELASLPERFFAFLIDNFIVVFVFSLIYWGEFSQHANNYYATAKVMSELIPQFALLVFAYEVVFLMFYGATFGKMIFKIRVISTSLLDTPSPTYILTRSIVKILSQQIFLNFPFLFVFFSPFKQAFHDSLAKTIVVKNA